MHDWSSACPPAAHPRPPLAPTAPRAQGSAAAPVDAFAWGSVVVGGPLDIGSEFERRLAAGAGIACRLRGAIARELGARSMGACTLPSSLPAHTPARLPAAAAAAAVQPGAASHLSPPHPTLTPPPPPPGPAHPHRAHLLCWHRSQQAAGQGKGGGGGVWGAGSPAHRAGAAARPHAHRSPKRPPPQSPHRPLPPTHSLWALQIGSALHKPDQQTVVPPRAAAGLLRVRAPAPPPRGPPPHLPPATRSLSRPPTHPPSILPPAQQPAHPRPPSAPRTSP